jgi:acetyl-CoA acetyltransferase
MGAGETPAQLGTVITAAMAVASGMARHVVVFRALTEGSAQAGTGRRGVIPGGANGRRHTTRHWSEWYAPWGAVSPTNLNAIAATRYMYDFGLTREQLGQVALTARANAARNPQAVYRDPMTMEDYLAGRMISSPLCLYDCDVPVDGATAIVVSHADTRRDLRRPPIRLVSAGGAVHGRYSFDQNEDLTITASHASAEQLWRHTDLTPADVDLAQLYDGFSILTLLWIEALGFCGRGEAGQFVDGGKQIAFDGPLPINTQGGQLSAGRLHGIGLVHEACLQLWGEAGGRQLPTSPEVAVVTNGGGPFCGALLLTTDR